MHFSFTKINPYLKQSVIVPNIEILNVRHYQKRGQRTCRTKACLERNLTPLSSCTYSQFHDDEKVIFKERHLNYRRIEIILIKRTLLIVVALVIKFIMRLHFSPHVSTYTWLNDLLQKNSIFI